MDYYNNKNNNSESTDDYDDDNIPEIDLPGTDVIPDEVPRTDGPGGE